LNAKLNCFTGKPKPSRISWLKDGDDTINRHLGVAKYVSNYFLNLYIYF